VNFGIPRTAASYSVHTTGYPATCNALCNCCWRLWCLSCLREDDVEICNKRHLSQNWQENSTQQGTGKFTWYL